MFRERSYPDNTLGEFFRNSRKCKRFKFLTQFQTDSISNGGGAISYYYRKFFEVYPGYCIYSPKPSPQNTTNFGYHPATMTASSRIISLLKLRYIYRQ